MFQSFRMKDTFRKEVDRTGMASSITDMRSTKSLKATPHLLSVLHSDTGYTGRGRTGEDLLYRWSRG